MKQAQKFYQEMGGVFRLFRIYTLKMTLEELGGKSLISSLSNFENGKLVRYNYFYLYIRACKSDDQAQKLIKLVGQIMYNAYKRGDMYDG